MPLRRTWGKGIVLLKVKNLCSGYGSIPVLHEVTLEVEEGEFCAIVGSNGAGKTTLLRTISGLVRPSSGEIFFGNDRLDGLEPHHIVERGLVLVPEGRQLFPHLTVMENLLLGSYSQRARSFRRRSLDEVLEIFPVLAERQKQLAHSLSGGEQQMLAIGRALMARPRMLMLDEPSWGLAPMVKEKLFEVLVRINAAGTTILLVEQDVTGALSHAAKAFVMERGEIVAEGDGKRLLASEELRKAYLGL